MKKYELLIITCCYWNANNEFQKWQKDGWELAGAITINSNESIIPMKKLIK